MVVGVIGCGVIGGALARYFESELIEVRRSDPAKGLNDSMEGCEAIFICVPVDNDRYGHQDQFPLWGLVGSHRRTPVFIRSTVLPGTCDRLAKDFGGQVYSCPEFLTERRADQDMRSLPVVTGCQDQALLSRLFPGKEIVRVSNVEAEIAKYAHNVLGAEIVHRCNTIYALAKKLGASYPQIMEAVMSSGHFNGRYMQVPGPDGQLGYGGKCLIPGTQISKPSGRFSVEDLQVGDVLLDWGNHETIVTAVGRRWVNETVEICARGRWLKGSPDHRQIVVTSNGFVEKEFSSVAVGDWIAVPQLAASEKMGIELGKKPNGYIKWWPEYLEMTEDLARVIGLYLADGCLSDDKYSTLWCFGEKKEEFGLVDEVIERLDRLGLHATKTFKVSNGTYGESRCWIVRLRSAGFHQVLKKLATGRGAKNKNCPILPNNLVPALVGGWLDGDGSISSGTVSGYSESTSLIAAIDSMLLGQGINASISKNGREIHISMREDVERVCQWTRRLTFDPTRYVREFAYESPNLRKIEGGWAVRVGKIKAGPASEVISLETSSHTYIANNILTHNCFPKDLIAFKEYLKHVPSVGAASLDAIDSENSDIRGKLIA